MRYALHLRILSLREPGGLLRFRDHLEQTADVDDILVVDVGADGTASGPTLSATWNSDIAGSISDYRAPDGRTLGDESPEPGVWVNHIGLPAIAAPIVGPDARIRLMVTP